MSFSFNGASPPDYLTTGRGSDCPWTSLEALPPDPRYRLMQTLGIALVLLRSHFFQCRSISIRFLKSIAISISFNFHTRSVGRRAKYFRWAGRDARSPGNAIFGAVAAASLRRPPLLKSRPSGPLCVHIQISSRVREAWHPLDLPLACGASAIWEYMPEHTLLGRWATRRRGQLHMGKERRGEGRRSPSTSVRCHPIRLKLPTDGRHYHSRR